MFGGFSVCLFECHYVVMVSVNSDFQVASYYGLPVSTTHCIIGSMVGFGLIYGGRDAVFWGSLARVTSSWLISPVTGAAVSFLVYKCIRRVCSCKKRLIYTTTCTLVC